VKPDVSFVLFKAVKPLQEQGLGQGVDALSRKVKNSHGRHHEVGPGVAPTGHLLSLLLSPFFVIGA
jgi:hypothetical protein